MRRYAAFERGEIASPLPEMVESVASALRMTMAERSALHILATGHDPPLPPVPPGDGARPEVSPVFLELLARQDPNPAIITDETWTIIARNEAVSAWAGGWLDQLPHGQQNLVLYLFSDACEALLPDVHAARRAAIAGSRYQYARNVTSDRFAALIARLHATGPEARELWNRHEIAIPPGIPRAGASPGAWPDRGGRRDPADLRLVLDARPHLPRGRPATRPVTPALQYPLARTPRTDETARGCGRRHWGRGPLARPCREVYAPRRNGSFTQQGGDRLSDPTVSATLSAPHGVSCRLFMSRARPLRARERTCGSSGRSSLARSAGSGPWPASRCGWKSRHSPIWTAASARHGPAGAFLRCRPDPDADDLTPAEARELAGALLEAARIAES